MRKTLFLLFFLASATTYDQFENLDILFQHATGYESFSIHVNREKPESLENKSDSFEKLIRWLQQSRDKTIEELSTYLYGLK